MAIHPSIEALLSQMSEANAPALNELPPEDGRAMYRLMNEANTKVEITNVRDESANGIPVRLYHPAPGSTLPCLIYYHGGGWVIGDIETHDHICRRLAASTECAVISVDYRLAPEHPYPAPLDDCYDALCWAAENAKQLDINPEKIAVGGDSAGGNLAAAVSIRARDESGPAIVHQLLVYPVTDTSMDTPSYQDNGEGYMLTKESMTWFWDHYIGDETNKQHPLIAPHYAETLRDLPSATVITAEYDPLRDEGEAYAEKLKAANVKTTMKRFDGMIHGFFCMPDLLEDSQQALDMASMELRHAFSVA